MYNRCVTSGAYLKHFLPYYNTHLTRNCSENIQYSLRYHYVSYVVSPQGRSVRVFEPLVVSPHGHGVVVLCPPSPPSLKPTNYCEW